MLFLFISKLKPSNSVYYKLSKRRESSSSVEGLNLVSCVSSPSALKTDVLMYISISRLDY